MKIIKRKNVPLWIISLESYKEFKIFERAMDTAYSELLRTPFREEFEKIYTPLEKYIRENRGL